MKSKTSLRLLGLMLCIAMTLTIFAGCGAEKPAETQAATAAAAAAPEAAGTQAAAEDGAFTVTDAVGRQVTLEGIPQKVLADDPACLRLYTYVNGMDRIIGVCEREKKSAARRPYALAFSEEIDALPTIGGGGYGIGNDEAVVLADPDVYFMGSGKEITEYDEIQSKTGVPVVVIDYGPGVVFDPKLYESIQLIGTIMDRQDRAQEVVDYMESLRLDMEQRTSDIPEDQIITAYAAGMAWNGSHGIEGTRENYPLLDVVNVRNVVTGTGSTGGMVEVDREQIIKWDPDYIILDLASIHLIQEDYNKNPQFYQNLKAFQEGRVYGQLPFVWCHVNVDTAMANAYYVGKVCYPDRFQDIDPIEKTNEIYETLLGKPVYDQIADGDYGGFQQITLEKLDANTYLKSK